MNWVLLLKATTWRLVWIPLTMLISYLYTGKLSGSIGLTAVLTVVLTVCQYGYERVWIRYLEDRVKRIIGAYKSPTQLL